MRYEKQSINILLGKVLVSVENCANEEIVFKTDTGSKFKMYHDQDCCESVTVEDICGELSDLVGSPITLAEEVSSKDKEFKEELLELFEYRDSDND